MRRIQFLLMASLSSLWLVVSPGLTAAQVPAATLAVVATNIPPGPLAAALQNFAESRHLQIVYASADVGTASTRGAKGELTAQRALQLLLRGTGLRFEFLSTNSVAIVPIAARNASTRSQQADPPSAPPPPRLVAAATDASASGAPEPNVLQEVVVTAERRSELQVNVPMSVDVLSAPTLQAEEIKTFNDFAQTVPNLNFNYGATYGNANDRAVAIRGIQGADTTGFYLDDLVLPISINPRVLDLARIEVLRGPQGTLYGARSMGGTVRMITAAPDPTQFNAQIFAQGTSVDGGGDGYEVHGTLNLPLTDKAAIRITPFRGQDGGYINREWPNFNGPTTLPTYQFLQQKNSAETEYEGVYSSLIWTPIKDLSIRPTVMYQSSAQNGLPLANTNPDNLTNFNPFDIPEGLTEKFLVTGLTINYSMPYGTITSSTSGLNRHTGDWEDVSLFTNFAFGTPLLPSPISLFNSNQIATEELRFTSNFPIPLQFTGGLWYDHEHDSVSQYQPIPGFLPIFGTSIAEALWSPTFIQERAVYGELTYSITPKWSVTVGDRYSSDSTINGGYQWGVVASAPSVAQAISVANSESDRVSTPKFLLKYQPTPGLDVYADAAKGFRPGAGQVPPPVAFCAAEYAKFGFTPTQLSSYKPDSVWSYEVGTKLLSADHRYSLNGALFWIEWTGMREFLELPCGFGVFLNTAKSRSRGVDFDFAAVPFEGLNLSGGLGYDNARIQNAGLAADFTSLRPGFPIPDVAPLTANLSAQYEFPLGENLQYLLRADYAYTGHSYSITNTPLVPRLRAAYSLWDFRTSLIQGRIQYSLFIKNIGDVHPNLGDQLSQAAEAPGRPRWEIGPPRTYGVEFQETF